MNIMDNFDDDLSLKQKEFVEPIDKATNKDLFEKKKMNLKRQLQKLFISIHLLQKIFIFLQKIQTINCLPG